MVPTIGDLTVPGWSEITSLSSTSNILFSSLSDCDKYYPTFQFLLWGNKTPKQAIAASLLETHGEA